MWPVIEFKTAMDSVLKSACTLLFTSSAYAATLTVGIHNETGDELASGQTTVALHLTDARAANEATGVIHRIEQIGAQFKPFISAVQKGSSIKFPNRDSFAHHVYSFSEPAKFQSELYSQQESHEIKVSKPGVVVVGCNIHDWMLAYVYVLDTPYFAQPVENSVHFEQLEPGAYSLSYWHPSMSSPVTTQLSIAEGAAKRVQLSINVERIEPIAAPSHSFHEDDDY